MVERIAVIAMESERHLANKADDVIVTGIGAVNVVAALSGLDRSTPLANIGYAGSNALCVGSKVSIGKVSLYHPVAEYDERTFDLGGDVPCYTPSDFVTETRIVEPCVFDMELAFILAMGFTDVVAQKTVSDILDMGQFEDCISRGAARAGSVR